MECIHGLPPSKFGGGLAGQVTYLVTLADIDDLFSGVRIVRYLFVVVGILVRKAYAYYVTDRVFKRPGRLYGQAYFAVRIKVF
jgi:hypothetical protein